ncbi:PLP-dependent aminotransferase family protein [Sinorhizobium sp. 8-89]|uniref:MocR-like pyridoxine biosynthesis transcription factor PdxR n=1 Tax=Sinorhizobium sp. 7-81 TaxID=3049087 RepID=UPI0024C32A76|nr:PLP-dependent aminotransferase family protein [Sinorhizobium sp. 7-81]MDK1388661.1 PLP-dependent aminotransferase family protein [Sinorhizobium sp. 7-81]
MAKSEKAPTVLKRICDAIKGQIRDATFRPGDRLPSTRGLAAEWGVSRTTVTAAYEQLAAEGYLETHQGARARVAKNVDLDVAACPPVDEAPRHPGLSDYGLRIMRLPAATRPALDRLSIDFRYGDLSSSDFPSQAWKKAVNAALMRRPARLRYADPAGSPALRTALQGYLWRARGLRCQPEQIIVVNGSQQGLDLCARLFVNPRDRVVVENPCYGAARHVFIGAGAELVPLDVDNEGMRTDGLGEGRLAYVTPSHQFPLGSVMSVGRRKELLAWARRRNAYVIEDDYDGEYRFDIAPIPALQTLDGADRVIYLGTVSKTLSPTLRLGYLVVPMALRIPFATAKRLTDRHTPTAEQEALAALIESGAYERHVRRVRRRNGERRAALLSALKRAFADRIRIMGADAGLHVVVWLSGLPREREQLLVERGLARGLGLYPIGPLFAASDGPGTAGLVLGYASLELPEIEEGVRRLKRVVDELHPALSS